MFVKNLKDDSIIAKDIRHATDFWERARGLLFAPPLQEGTGLLIEPCNSVHTFLMAYPIDVIFLDDKRRIVHIINSMKPWRVSKIVRKARSALELPAGTALKFSLKTGDVLEIVK